MHIVKHSSGLIRWLRSQHDCNYNSFITQSQFILIKKKKNIEIIQAEPSNIDLDLQLKVSKSLCGCQRMVKVRSHNRSDLKKAMKGQIKRTVAVQTRQ